MRFSSSHVFWPNSVAQSWPCESKASPCTLRWPSVQTGEPRNGLSAGTEPSRFSRRILPPRLSSSCASGGLPDSPVPTQSLPSGPRIMRPPSWLPAFGMPVSTVDGVPSRPFSYGIRTMRLSLSAVKYA
jgi:hypothetical protein